MFVKQWMGTEVVTVAPNETVAAAEKLLKGHKIRRLPVVEEGILVGIISPHDLRKVMPSILDAEGAREEDFIADHTEIRTVMTSSPITVGPDDTLVEAIRKMRRNKVDGLPVIEDMKVVGILSITDILDAFLEIMTGGQPGTRLDLKIDHSPESFYKMVKVFQKQNKEVLALTQHYGYSADHHLVTVQIRESDNDELVDMLWKNGATVERITSVS
ncbi:MAG: CBS domain-containing protein [Desulforhopalus sp.]|nr:CBS domain-containing protein [Desulforhopalus sp.]